MKWKSRRVRESIKDHTTQHRPSTPCSHFHLQLELPSPTTRRCRCFCRRRTFCRKFRAAPGATDTPRRPANPIFHASPLMYFQIRRRVLLQLFLTPLLALSRGCRLRLRSRRFLQPPLSPGSPRGLRKWKSSARPQESLRRRGSTRRDIISSWGRNLPTTFAIDTMDPTAAAAAAA